MPESKTPIGRGSDKLEDPELLEVEIEEASVNCGQLLEIGEAHVLVDLVDGLGEESELNDRAELLDEARVRRAAIGGKRRRDSGDLAHRLRQDRVELARLGQERVAWRFEGELEFQTARLEDLCRHLPHFGLQRLR